MSAGISKVNGDLQTLVQELAKTNPDIKQIKNKTEVLGIAYSPDLITLMSEVLVYLSKNKSSLKPLQKPLLKQLKEKQA